MNAEEIKNIVINALEDLKGLDIKSIDVKELTSITDYMVICTGRSTRHVKSLADNVIKFAKENKLDILGEEGADVGEWVLVDLGDVVVHAMLSDTREFYNLEGLWEAVEVSRSGTD